MDEARGSSPLEPTGVPGGCLRAVPGLAAGCLRATPAAVAHASPNRLIEARQPADAAAHPAACNADACQVRANRPTRGPRAAHADGNTGARWNASQSV